MEDNFSRLLFGGIHGPNMLIRLFYEHDNFELVFCGMQENYLKMRSHTTEGLFLHLGCIVLLCQVLDTL